MPVAPVSGQPMPLQPPRQRIRREAIELLDGDTLGGRFIGLDPKKGVRWKHPAIAQELHFDPAKVARITVPRTGLPAGARHHACRVRLANGDELTGELKSLINDKLVLNTWYAGQLSIMRSAGGSGCRVLR